MTELLGIKHPVMLSGMGWMSTPEFVAAVSNAGGLGVLPCSGLTAEDLKNDIGKIRGLTDKPFGVNLTLGVERATLIPTLAEEKVPLVEYSLGRPPEISRLIQAVHGYGGKVMGKIGWVRHARRAEELGVDILNVAGFEAAGHPANVGALVLVPTVIRAVKIPCIATGGYTDGSGLVTALALGAEGIAMGTRLATTRESPLPDNIKDAWLKATEEDTIIDPAFDGINARVLRNKAATEMMKKRFPLIDAIAAALYMKKKLKLSFPELIRTTSNLRNQEIGLGSGKRSLASVMRFAVGSDLFRKATQEGALESGLILTSQGVGLIHDIPTVKELMERTITEAEEVLKSVRAKFKN